MQRFSNQKILVAGLVRNGHKTVRKDVFKLFASLKHCRALSWLVIESDSSDQTVATLGKLEGDVPNFRFISLGTLRDRMPNRTERIAHCRNVYLDELKANRLYTEVDYVVLADLDGTNDLITTSGFASCWKRSDWDVCTANQRGPYYDIWALRHSHWNPNDWQQQYDFLHAHNVRREAAMWAACYSRMITIDPSEEWIEVDSAFGGLAVYRKEAICDARYIGLDEAGNEVCEHVSFNNQLKLSGRRIFINPELINTAYTEHSRQLRLPQRLRRYFFAFRNQLKARLRDH